MIKKELLVVGLVLVAATTGLANLVVNGDFSSSDGWTVTPVAGILPQYSMAYANIGANIAPGNGESRIYRQIGTIDTTKTYTFTASLATRVYDSAGYMSSNPAVLYSSAYITVLHPDAGYAVSTLQLANTNTSVSQDPQPYQTLTTTYTPNPAHNGLAMYVVWQGWYTGSWNAYAGMQGAVDDLSVIAIPEPATLGFLGFGCLSLFGRRLKR